MQNLVKFVSPPKGKHTTLGYINQLQNIRNSSWLCRGSSHWYTPDFRPNTKKIVLTWDVTFLWKSYSEYGKIEYGSYKGSDDEDELKMNLLNNNNNKNLNIVSDSISDNSEDNIEMTAALCLMKISMTMLKQHPKLL